MDSLYVFISLLVGIAVGFITGYIICSYRSLQRGTSNVEQKEIEIIGSDLRFSRMEQERLSKELNTKENEIKEYNIKFQDMFAEVARMKTIAENAQAQADRTETEHEVMKKQLKDSIDELMHQKAIHSSELEKNRYLQEKLDTQKKEIEEMGQKFTKEFQLLANEILEQKSKKFTEQNQSNLRVLLDPLGKNIDEFKKKVEETYDKESKERFSLAEKVKELSEMSLHLKEEATNLTQALKGSVKQMGSWGEMLLESILQNSGLRKGYEYYSQEFIRDNAGETVKDDDGKKLQPDVIVNLPDERQIIIDSKVSLLAYDKYIAVTNKTEQTNVLNEHIKSIKSHIDNLSAKNYHPYVKSLEFVMLFVPVEPAYIIAMQHDNTLWEYAYKKRILLISPTNLIAALKLIADLWQKEQKNKNALEIAKRGSQLYEKFINFVESLEDIGKKLDGAQKSYEQAITQLKTGKGNLIRQAEMLNKLGIKAQKSIPVSMTEEVSDEVDDS